MQQKKTLSRRRLLQLGTTAAAALPLAHILITSPVLADDLPHLATDNPTAAALGYTEDTTSVDKAANPRHEVSQKCSNCVLVQGADGDQWRPCAIFPGSVVNADGWCKSWAPKA